MPLQDSLSLIETYEASTDFHEQVDILNKLSLCRSLSEQTTDPEVLISALEAYTNFVIGTVKPFQLKEQIVQTSELLMNGGLKVFLGMTGLLHALVFRVTRDQFTDTQFERMAHLLQSYWTHLQFLVMIKRCRGSFHNNRIGCTEPQNLQFPKYFLSAYILLESVFLCTLDALIEGRARVQGVANPSMFVDAAARAIDPKDAAVAFCYGVPLQTELIHAHIDRAWACAKACRKSFPCLLGVLNAASAEAKLYFEHGRVVGCCRRSVGVFAKVLIAWLVLALFLPKLMS